MATEINRQVYIENAHCELRFYKYIKQYAFKFYILYIELFEPFEH